MKRNNNNKWYQINYNYEHELYNLQSNKGLIVAEVNVETAESIIKRLEGVDTLESLDVEYNL